MDQQGQGCKNAIEGEQMMLNPSQGSYFAAGLGPTAQTPVFAGQLASAYQQMQQKREQELGQRLKAFWARQVEEVRSMTDFKNHSLPLARIKKIMKADEDVKMISAEAPIVFAKACELFVLDLTLRSWCNTEENKRRTLQKADVIDAIARTDIFDFLVDIIPKEDIRDDPLLSLPRNSALVDTQNRYLPAVPPQQPAVDPDFYRRHIPYVPPPMWYAQAEEPQPPPSQSASDS